MIHPFQNCALQEYLVLDTAVYTRPSWGAASKPRFFDMPKYLVGHALCRVCLASVPSVAGRLTDLVVVGGVSPFKDAAHVLFCQLSIL